MPRQNKEMVASHRAHSLIFALGNSVSAAAMVAGQIRATPYPPKSGAHLKAEKKHRAASNEREALSDRDRDLRRELSADLKNVRAFSYTTTQMQLQRDIDELATRLVAAENAWRGAHAELFQHAERYRRTLQIHANEMHDSSLWAMSDVFDLVATVTRPLLTLNHVWEQQAGNVNGTFFYPPSDPRVAFAPYIARALIDLADVFCVARPDLTPDDPPITLPAMPDSLVALKAVKDQGRLDAEAARRDATELIHDNHDGKNDLALQAATARETKLTKARDRAAEAYYLAASPYRDAVGAVLTAEVQRIKGDINAARAALACVADAVFALQSIVKDAGGAIRPVLCTYTAHKPHMLIERLRTLLKGTG